MIPRRHQLLRAAVTAALVNLLLIPALTHAQDDPVIIGQQRQVDPFHIERPILTLELISQYSRERSDTAGQTTSARELLFEEILAAETSGYILHPNFIELNLAGSFGLTQSWLEVNDEDDRQTGTLYTWDVRGTLLPDRDTPLTLYSQRTRRLINREFGPTLESTVTTTGAALDIRSPSIPTRLDISRTVSEQSSLTGQRDFELTRDRFLWTSSYRPTPNQHILWNYVFSRVSQEGFADTSFDTHDASLSHVYTFGPQNNHSLTSGLTYSNQQGDFDFERFRLNERLWLRHSRTFETRYEYTFDNYRFAESDQTRHRATASFVHRLYDSLITNGRIGAQRLSGTGENSTEYFTDIDLDYRKKVPFGTFRLTPAAGYNHREVDGTGDPLLVINQPRAFDNGTPIIVIGPDIDPNTLVVRDPATLFTYVEGIDYTVTSLPDRLEIDRIVGGRIPAGSPVLLNYVLPPLPPSTIATTSLSLGSRYDLQEGPLRGLGFYGRYLRVDQDIDTANPAAIIENSFTDRLIGIDYRFWDATIGAERQWHDSVVAPFDSMRYFARVATRLDTDTSLTLNASYQQLDYRSPSRSVDVLTGSAALRHEFSRSFSATGTVLYRHQRDDFGGDSTGFEQQLELEWRHRQTTIYGLVRNATLDSEFQDTSFQLFLIGFKRVF